MNELQAAIAADDREILAHRVMLGAAGLDRVYPDWALRVVTDTLNMTVCTKCVIGQLTGDVDNFQKLFPWWPSMGLAPTPDHPLMTHGFWLEIEDGDTSDRNFHRYKLLTQLWKDVIFERRTPVCATCGEHSPRGPFRGMVHRYGPRDHPFIAKPVIQA